ncbi:hypothetical protein [Pseudoalteromonas sp. T1lg75]|uniref:hypothetical protein n=1 Tax=Pseudoalteromonas sp. T1lg75 TaxID=2077102 RepID=UPI000CF5ECDA|nr:hypothetical protein [Pseudoalteromonas sp. T1lg75]
MQLKYHELLIALNTDDTLKMVISVNERVFLSKLVTQIIFNNSSATVRHIASTTSTNLRVVSDHLKALSERGVLEKVQLLNLYSSSRGARFKYQLSLHTQQLISEAMSKSKFRYICGVFRQCIEKLSVAKGTKSSGLADVLAILVSIADKQLLLTEQSFRLFSQMYKVKKKDLPLYINELINVGILQCFDLFETSKSKLKYWEIIVPSKSLSAKTQLVFSKSKSGVPAPLLDLVKFETSVNKKNIDREVLGTLNDMMCHMLSKEITTECEELSRDKYLFFEDIIDMFEIRTQADRNEFRELLIGTYSDFLELSKRRLNSDSSRFMLLKLHQFWDTSTTHPKCFSFFSMIKLDSNSPEHQFTNTPRNK